MQLDELTYDEQMAFGGLLRLLLRSDGQFSEAEETILERIGARMAGGADKLWKVISQSAQEHTSDAAILEAATKVERGEVQLMIRSVLEEVAAADEVAEPEHQLLLHLQDLWG